MLLSVIGRIQNVKADKLIELPLAGAAVYDIDFNPHMSTQFCAVSDNGRVAVWDMRRGDRSEKHWLGHSGLAFTCRWHPEVRPT